MSELLTIARPYAKAIFELALENKAIKEWSTVLKALATVAGNPAMTKLLHNPRVSNEQLISLFIDILGGVVNEQAEHLLSLLASKKRLNALPDIAKLYEAFVAEREKTIEVKVVSAFPIDKNRKDRLEQALQGNLNRQVTVEWNTDKDLIGGAIIYAGDQVFDGSLRSKLKRLTEQLAD